MNRPDRPAPDSLFTDAAPECSPQSFMGDFAEATHDLLMEDSADKRAAAARRLASLGRPLASPYLIAALSDNEPVVRQAAVESLAHLGDSEAIAPLQDLLSRASGDAVLQHAISQAIHSISSRTANVSITEPLIEKVFSRPDQEELLRSEEDALRQAALDLERRRS
ncbi:MAG: HEAT repeat domain-containing protein, partial [Pyrinomonadaceae bacterium]